MFCLNLVNSALYRPSLRLTSFLYLAGALCSSNSMLRSCIEHNRYQHNKYISPPSPLASSPKKLWSYLHTNWREIQNLCYELLIKPAVKQSYGKGDLWDYDKKNTITYWQFGIMYWNIHKIRGLWLSTWGIILYLFWSQSLSRLPTYHSHYCMFHHRAQDFFIGYFTFIHILISAGQFYKHSAFILVVQAPVLMVCFHYLTHLHADWRCWLMTYKC